MWSILTQPSVQAAMSVLALLVVCFLSAKGLARIRDLSRYTRREQRDATTNFEEMHLAGDISDQEYRNIQSVLGKTMSNNAGGDAASR
jgi:uncharacterized membrane protein